MSASFRSAGGSAASGRDAERGYLGQFDHFVRVITRTFPGSPSEKETVPESVFPSEYTTLIM